MKSGAALLDVRPAAARWPPPPSARAIAETSTRSDAARSDARRPPPCRCAHEGADLRSTDSPQGLGDAVGVVGPGGREVVQIEHGHDQAAVEQRLGARVGDPEQPHLGERHVLVQPPADVRRRRPRRRRAARPRGASPRSRWSRRTARCPSRGPRGGPARSRCRAASRPRPSAQGRSRRCSRRGRRRG